MSVYVCESTSKLRVENKQDKCFINVQCVPAATVGAITNTTVRLDTHSLISSYLGM